MLEAAIVLAGVLLITAYSCAMLHICVYIATDGDIRLFDVIRNALEFVGKQLRSPKS